MSFRIDKQTIRDIELFSENEKTPSLFGFYNGTETIGGQEQLFNILRTPFSDRSFLENRKVEISDILSLKHSLKLIRRQFDFAEYYLRNRHIPLKNNIIDATRDSIANKLKPSNDYYVISQGILHLTTIMNDFKRYLENINDTNPPASLDETFSSSLQFINDKSITKVIENMPDDSEKIKSKHINHTADCYLQFMIC